MLKVKKRGVRNDSIFLAYVPGQIIVLSREIKK